MIKIAIVDDDKNICDNIYKEINTTRFLDSLDYRIHMFYSAKELFATLKKENFDIILLDIEMPDIDGLKVAEILRKDDISSIIIFITSNLAYMKEAFGLNIFAFLDKGELKQSLAPVLQRCINFIESNIAIPFKSNEGILKLHKKDIIIAEYDKRKVCIYTKNNKFIVNLPSLAKFMELVNDSRFISVNRTCIINLSYLIYTADNLAYMKNYPSAIPISYERVKMVNDSLMKWISQRSAI